MIGAEIVGQVRAAGGQIAADGADLVLTAPRPLPGELLDRLKAHKPAILAALSTPAAPRAAGSRKLALPPLSPASEARRRKVLAMLARDGGRYAVLAEDPNTDPVIAALATPDGTCELLIPRDRYDPFAVLEMVHRWNTEPDPLWWRVSITDPGGRPIEVDAPSGWTLADWQAYAERYHGSGCTVTPIAGLPTPRPPVNLDDALRTACEGVVGITPEVFRSLLSPEDIKDIEAGGIHRKTLKGYAESFAEGIRSGRIVVLPERTS